ncbi:multicopper oxidase family protein [Polyangium sp. 15x6]|uniref:multicopper oxidase family protein n=1 Tax=Polyangium sp. 15x6 TaxID=3042687 RepID=UPI00249C6A0C|nr:multicopper oxidase family protein [Polyangium sp. 15x6]MDI3289305.1 multicopper oxidase family protein [Polyangium sp. 15x6]
MKHEAITRAALAVLLSLLPSCATKQEPLLEQRLLAEFAEAYPTASNPNGIVRSFDITAAEVELPLLDGKPLRVWTYNGQVPGPELRVRLGETVRVRFTNRLPQPTTIHWHGVRVPNDMDGVPTQSRPAIKPGESFVYEFTPKDAGTFWFHPHIRSSEQVERGLFGVLIVEDPAPPAYSRDVVWVVDDWLLGQDGQIVPAFNTRHDLAHDGRWGNHVTVNGRTNEVLALRPGERIRLRIVNVANGRVFAPDFGGLAAKIVAVDGLYVRTSFDASGFELAPGNRIDVDLMAGSAGAAVSIEDRFLRSRPRRLAEIRVAGDPVETPRFEPPTRRTVPAWTAGSEVPVHAELALDARRGGPFGIEWTINGVAFQGHESATGHTGIPLVQGQFNHLRFANHSARLHPIHLHGMFFRVLTRNGRAVEEPFFRDTVLVHPRETVDVGVVPVDEGSWMLHCHILEHAEAGMMTMLEVGSANGATPGHTKH